MKFYEYKYQCSDCAKSSFCPTKIPDGAEKLCVDCYQELMKRIKDEAWSINRIRDFEAKHTIYMI